MSEQAELEALLRAAYRDFPGFDPTGDVSLEKLDRHHQQVWRNAVAHLRAEKVQAEAAALERAKEYFKPLQGTEGAFSWRGERIVSDLDKMISPAGRSALAERDAGVGDEALERAAILFDQNAKDCAWISAAIRALKSSAKEG